MLCRARTRSHERRRISDEAARVGRAAEAPVLDASALVIPPTTLVMCAYDPLRTAGVLDADRVHDGSARGDHEQRGDDERGGLHGFALGPKMVRHPHTSQAPIAINKPVMMSQKLRDDQSLMASPALSSTTFRPVP